MLLKTQYDKHRCNGQKLTQLQRKFSHITYNVNEAKITTGLLSTYPGSNVAKNQADALIIEYRDNIAYDLEEAGKGPAATHIRNMQIIEEYCTLDRRIKYIKGKFRKPGTNFSLNNKPTAVHYK